jgi:ribosomal protein S8
MNCIACQTKIINNNDRLACSTCKDSYHYKCLGMTTEIYKSRQGELKHAWRCPSCINITLRRKNDNTPVCSPLETRLNDTNMSVDDLMLDDTQNSVLGDTLASTRHQNMSTERQTITIEQISAVFDAKLKENNDEIVSKLRIIIQSEINTAVTKLHDEFTQINNTIITKQELFAKQLQNSQQKIEILETENCELKKELVEIKARLVHLNSSTSTSHNDDNGKKFVLYGLDEYYNNESEEDVITRINYLFRDLLNIDINGYIETVKRIGKKGNRRPLTVELISNRMKRYILNHAHCFRKSGYSISMILTKDELEQRFHLRECLKIARSEGKHAIIRNNKLYIDGKEHYLESNKPTVDDTLPKLQCPATAQNLTNASSSSLQSERSSTGKWTSLVSGKNKDTNIEQRPRLVSAQTCAKDNHASDLFRP